MSRKFWFSQPGLIFLDNIIENLVETFLVLIPILYEDALYEPPCSPPLVRGDGVSRGVKYVAVSSRNGIRLILRKTNRREASALGGSADLKHLARRRVHRERRVACSFCVSPSTASRKSKVKSQKSKSL
jgi:hypothetical protein